MRCIGRVMNEVAVRQRDYFSFVVGGDDDHERIRSAKGKTVENF